MVTTIVTNGRDYKLIEHSIVKEKYNHIIRTEKSDSDKELYDGVKN